MTTLRLDPDDLAVCVQCGLCLPHCPTYRVTGDDARSPRGRIGLMRAVEAGAPVTDEVVEAMESCVQCRGCEPACPSAVPFGSLIADTRSRLTGRGTIGPRWLRVALWPLDKPGLLRAGSTLLALAQRTRLVPSRRFGLPERLPVRRPELPASGDDVWLFTGCVQDAWLRSTHVAAQAVLEHCGLGVRPTGDLAPCCGALHHHAGFEADARRKAERVVASLDGGPGDTTPILVDSAGCGAALREYGEFLGTDAARRVAARVQDVAEFVAPRLGEVAGDPLPIRVAVQDPCHLRHVQRAHQPVRELLRPLVAELVELDDDGLCCGAGGAYAVVEPELAREIRDRKTTYLDRADADVVASANPGCALHLAAAGYDTRHPIELVARALGVAGF